MGRLCKGPVDLAKLEPALSRHPSGRISNHARVFAPVSRTAFGNNKFLKFMKPTPQISHNQHAGFPLTDYNYQPTGDAKSTAGRPARKSPAFYRLSHEFFGAEMSRDYVTNFLVFTVIAVVTTWPIISMIVAVTRMARY